MGKPLLIFITVGTSRYPFTRLLDCVLPLAHTLGRNSRIVVQGGCGSVPETPVSHVFWHDYMDPYKVKQYMKKADRIITQAGPASLFEISRHASVMPLIIPRRHAFHEHVNDHQVEFGLFIRDRLPPGLKRFVVNTGSTSAAVSDYVKNKRIPNRLEDLLFNPHAIRRLCRRMDGYMKTL